MAVYVFFDPSIVGFAFDIDTQKALPDTIWIRVYTLLFTIIALLGVCCVFLFRKSLRYFQKNKPFDLAVIELYNRIGKILIITGLGAAMLFFIIRIFMLSEIKINLGISPYIIVTCLGLFFMVLSETFLIAKTVKEENDLTI